MSFISEPALRWAMTRLKAWADVEPPGSRVKQVIYRLLLLRELGVNDTTPVTLSTGDFKRHAHRFLLALTGTQAASSGNVDYYFVPVSCLWQKASDPSDWAIGTMWTRCQTWQSDGIITFPTARGARDLQFSPNYLTLLEGHLGNTRLPGLPLAIFLLRDSVATGIPLTSVTDTQSLVDLFRTTFRISDASFNTIFDFDPGGFTGTLLAASALTEDELFTIITDTVPSPLGPPVTSPTSAAASSGRSTGSAYAIADGQKRGLCGRPVQVLVHGCPGSGKSHLLKEWASDVSVSSTVVFHPETTYGDLIGVFRPKSIYRPATGGDIFVDEAGEALSHGEPYITYEFVPGPLLHMYCFAKSNPGESVVLIIEELSRGNASLVFGDTLQLLDRLDSDSGSRARGESVYEISPRAEISAYLSRFGIDRDSGGKMRFPPNLHIWASMNRSDQNARQLDAAFLRRWDKVYLSFDEPCAYGSTELDVPGGRIQWDLLRSKINSALIGLAPEDKFIGPYFLKESRLSDKEAVAEDLLGYLWNDVLKARAPDFFAFPTFAQTRHAWISGTSGSPFRNIQLP